MGTKYRLSTLGCKVNQYESQQIIDLCRSLGLTPARDGEAADIAFVNTCAVTHTALRKSQQETRRLSRGGHTAVIVVGCGASADARRMRKIEGVAAVFDHHADIPAELRKLLTSQPLPARCCPSDKRQTLTLREGSTLRSHNGCDHPMGPTKAQQHATQAVEPPRSIISSALPVVKTGTALVGRIERFDGHQRAFLKVQDGCDAYCTYCVIPQLRPALRSKPMEVAVAEARALVRAGHREIIVTGIFLGAYGRDTAIRRRFKGEPSPFAKLVKALAQVEGLERLRLSSLEPGDVDETLLEVLADQPACVPHLHLPLQSGSAEVLRRMNRQYTRDEFVTMIERVRAALDRPAISTDIIVGFPGETEEDFEASLRVARQAEFLKIHAFPFSPREKTAAASWQQTFVPPPLVRERMQRLAEVERQCSLAYRRRAIGKVERVLVEGSPTTSLTPLSKSLTTPAEWIYHGRTDRYFAVHFEENGDSIRPGDLVGVRINRVTSTRTHGTQVSRKGDRMSSSRHPSSPPGIPGDVIPQDEQQGTQNG